MNALLVPINENILIAGGMTIQHELFSDARILDIKRKSVSYFETGIKFACKGNHYYFS